MLARVALNHLSALAAMGLSGPEIGRELGCHHSTVYRKAGAAGVPIARAVPRKATPAAVAAAIAECGPSPTLVSRALGISKSYARDLIDKRPVA